MKKFRHGFKAEAERIATELRAELRLRPGDPLDPVMLADHLHVPVLTLMELRKHAPAAVDHFTGRGKSLFSAVTIHVSRFKRVIVTNPTHARARQVNSICHELGHILLDHVAEAPVDPSGARAWDGIQEGEADWVASCLLIPAEGAVEAARRGDDDDDVAAAYGVSRAVARWRMGATGARIIAKRSARYR